MSASAERVLDILSFLAEQPDGATLKDITSATAISRATAYRTTAALIDSGWVLVNGTPTRYFASRRVAQLGLAMLRQDGVREAILPNAIDLARVVGCVCMLAFYEAGDAVYTDAIEVFGERVMPTPSGVRRPAFATACGKILLSTLGTDEIQRILAAAEVGFTATDSFNSQSLYAEIRLARDRGYAVSNREFSKTASGIAVPIFGRDGKVAAAIGVHADSGVDDDFVARVLPTALEFARKASAELGHRSPRRSALP